VAVRLLSYRPSLATVNVESLVVPLALAVRNMDSTLHVTLDIDIALASNISFIQRIVVAIPVLIVV
jgi:hypothetical protein